MRILHFGAVLTMLLAACGGGGGDGDTPVDAAEADMVETADDLAAKDGTSPDDAATETAADQLVQLPPIDYLVITASGLMATAEAFAEYRASTGHVTFVATVQSAIGGLAAPTDSIIVDEITGFVRGHYYKRDPDKPFFLLIVGDADASDNDPNETVPAGTWVGGWEGCRSDNFYADVDGDHVPDLAVGRIPVRSNADGQLILDKIMKHESEYEVGPWNHRLHVYAGEGGFGDDIDMFIEKIAEEGLVSVPYEYDLYFAYDSPTSTYYYTPFEEKVFGLVTDGALLVTYMGHGGGELDVPDLSQVVVKHRQPMYAFFACGTGDFIGEWDSQPEQVMKQEGGPMALLVSQTTTHPYGNAINALELEPAVLAEQPETYGEAVVRMKWRSLYNTSDLRDTIDAFAVIYMDGGQAEMDAVILDHMYSYNLLGDPAVRIRFPAGKVELEAGEGYKGAALEFSGSLDTFDTGEAEVRLVCERSGLIHQLTPVDDPTDPASAGTVQDNWNKAMDHDVAATTVELSGGAFSGSLLVPQSTGVGTYHLVVYADNGTTDAVGSVEVKVKKQP